MKRVEGHCIEVHELAVSRDEEYLANKFIPDNWK